MSANIVYAILVTSLATGAVFSSGALVITLMKSPGFPFLAVIVNDLLLLLIVTLSFSFDSRALNILS